MNTEIEPHPIADIFPMMTGSEYANFKDDVYDNGLLEPIWIYEEKILDGRNRYKACLETGTDAEYRNYEGSDPVGFVISLNLSRRHLNESQRAMVAANIANLENGQHSSANLQSTSRSEAAEKLNVSERTVNTAKKVQKEGAKELVDKVQAGTVSVSAAADVATLPEEEQKEIVAKGEKEILEAAKKIREQKSVKRRAENAVVAKRKMEPPTGKYSTLVVDPPWDMQKFDRDNRPNQTGVLDYPTMSKSELMDFGLLVDGCAADHSHLFMWTTQKWLPFSIELLNHWGWKYVLTMVWHKPGGPQPFGLPQYNCEFCLYGRKGSPEFRDFTAFPTCFSAPRKEHSRKPDEFYDLIERVTHDGRIDIFSREHRNGFAQYGNEQEKFS